MYKPYPLKVKPNCAHGYDFTIQIQYFQDDFPDGPIEVPKNLPCDNANGSVECIQCLSKYSRIAQIPNLTLDLLRELFG